MQEAPRTVTLADARVEQPSVSRYYLAPSRTRPSPARARRSKCWPTCSAAASNSRLYQTLVVEQNIALNAGAYYSSTALDYGKFGVYGSPKPGKTLQDVETAIDAVIADVSEHGVTADELELAKNRLIADAVYAQDNQATLARWYGAALATGETVDMVRNWPEGIRAVTAEAVRDAARDLAQPPRVGHRLSGQQLSGEGETHVNAIISPTSGVSCRDAAAVAIVSARCFSPRRPAPPPSSGW